MLSGRWFFFFFTFKKPSSPSESDLGTPESNPAFQTKGKSRVLYRLELEHWILSHMQIILSLGIRNISKHISVNTL